MAEPLAPTAPSAAPVTRPGPLARLRRAAASLPGKLLVLTILFVLLAEVLIFLPSAANFRTAWLDERTAAAHLAAIAAESAEDSGLGDDLVRELLAGADAVAVARIAGGSTELVLGGDVGEAETIEANLIEEGFFERMAKVPATMAAPAGRYLIVTDVPETRPGERIVVVLPEAPLKSALIAYSIRIFWLSIFISLVTGGLIFLALLILIVRPMSRLSQAMTDFQADPSDRRRILPETGRTDEIGQAETALSAMQSDVLAALRQRERLAALGEGVAKINHDLRNILSSAQLVSDRLATSDDPKVAAMGQRLVRSIDRGIKLCEAVLDYGKADEPAPELAAVNLSDCVEAARRDAFARSAEIAWVNMIDPDLNVQADPDQIHRIFLNLFRNAAQAMEGQERRAMSAAAYAEDQAVRVRVTDTGPGIPQRVRESLFTAFGRSGTTGGSGLGLAISRELAQGMGGDVALIGTGDGGTVFEIRLMRA